MNAYTVRISPSKDMKNATPAVVSAIRELERMGGGILQFEKGDYHFFEDGTVKKYYAVSNNSAGEKKIVFSLRNLNGITVDGGGSRFIIHGRIFPFAFENCQNVTLRNIYFDRDISPHVSLKVRDITDTGFGLEIDRKRFPFYVKDRSLFLTRQWGDYSGRTSVFSLHSADRIRVRYLLTGDCTARYDNLPTPYMWADAEETEWGVRLTYRSVEGAQPCLYEEGEHLSVFPDGGRENALTFFEDCENIHIENITVRQSIGMGVIAQLCRNITIHKFCTDYDEQAGGVAITVDALHFVNCDGKLEISDCHITHTEDDILNVHGMYTLLRSASEQKLSVQIMHHEQYGFCPYRKGDRLTFIDRDTMQISGAFFVDSYEFENEEKNAVRLVGCWEYGLDAITNATTNGKEFLVENPDRMPDLHLHHNHFYHFPHLRISGAGQLLIEHNHIERARAAALLMDLSKYWYESGRIHHLVFRHNRMIDCNAMGAEPGFIQIGVSGFDNSDAPLIHEYIEISDNEFYGIDSYAVNAGGVKNLIIKDNRGEQDKPLPMKIEATDQ